MKRNDKIIKIKSIIGVWGSVTSSELSLDSSPCINSIGNGKNNVSQLIERFYMTGVEAITYHDEIELGEDYFFYEDLSDEIIDEIFYIMEEYDADMYKTMKRCQD